MLGAAGLPAEQIGPVAVRLQQPVPVGSLPGFSDGLVSVQDLAAQRRQLRTSAAACGCWTRCRAGREDRPSLAAAVELTAIDRDPQRLQRVRENLERLRLEARLVTADAADLDSWWDGQPFERVLLDAPCSASGVVRRHPDIKWLRRPEDIAHLAREQNALLSAVAALHSRWYIVLYATCAVPCRESGADRRLPERPQERASADNEADRWSAAPGRPARWFFYALLQKAVVEPA
jgi:16S rRNA (cytosine967-C5)-methyltransferase